MRISSSVGSIAGTGFELFTALAVAGNFFFPAAADLFALVGLRAEGFLSILAMAAGAPFSPDRSISFWRILVFSAQIS
jgi:hypothetical protein